MSNNFKCGICNKFFRDNTALKKHQNAKKPKGHPKIIVKSSKEKINTIVKKEGRNEYDSSIPRLATGNNIDRQPEINYESIQKMINCGPGKTINTEELEKYFISLRVIGKEFEQYTFNQVQNILPGSRVAYITKTPRKWRSGGYFISSNISTHDTDGKIFDIPKIYLLYKGFNNAVYSVQFEDIEQFYVRIKQKNKRARKEIVTFKLLKEKTNFPVFLKNEHNESIIVCYARDTINQRVFMSTKKYEYAKNNPSKWVFDS